LDHLCSFEHEFVQDPEPGKKEKRYKFIIEFSFHCFTRGPNKHKGEKLEDVDSSLHYSDSRDKRIWCFDRYKLSFFLPDIARGVSQKKCYNTGKGNFFLIDLVESDGSISEYEVYFKVTRAGKGVLRLYVESAYIRDAEHGSAQPKKKKIRFFVIAYNVQKKKPIK
jgi:hypothetical protein